MGRCTATVAGATWLGAVGVGARESHRYQGDLPAEELTDRRVRVLEELGDNAVAFVQGAPNVRGFHVFRQSNESASTSASRTSRRSSGSRGWFSSNPPRKRPAHRRGKPPANAG